MEAGGGGEIERAREWASTVILFSSRYLFPAKSICPTCKQAIQIFMQIRAASPANRSFVIFLSKFVLPGHSHRYCRSASSGRVWKLDMV